MRGKSHYLLGEYLAKQYLSEAPKCCIQAFLLGCVQPDINPATYFKGSLRYQWMRGHNYPNSERFMERLCIRLESRHRLTLPDYYALGKLIHYTADAFTYAHNRSFPDSLELHRQYEASLHRYFPGSLQHNRQSSTVCKGSLMDTIRFYHREYSRKTPHIHYDAAYAQSTCCSIMTYLSDRQKAKPSWKRL